MNHDYQSSDLHLAELPRAQLLAYELQIAGQAWPTWLGGFVGWVRGCPPEANMLAFRKKMAELRRATMLEF